MAFNYIKRKMFVCFVDKWQNGTKGGFCYKNQILRLNFGGESY